MSWNASTIGSLVGKDGLFCDGDWVESEDQDPNGDVRLIQLADIGDGNYVDKSNRFLTSRKAKELRCTYLNSGDVLVARMPDPLGRACIFPGDKKRAVTVVDVCVIRSNDDEFHHRWLMHFLNAPQMRSKVAALQSGSTRKRISRGNLATIELPVPPKKIQEKISLKVDELFSDLDAGVAALKHAQANLKRYRAAVLKAAVEGTLTEQWRADRKAKGVATEPVAQLLARILAERRKKWEAAQLKKYADAGKAPRKGWQSKYVEPAALDASDLPQLPEGWGWCSLDQASWMVKNGLPQKPSVEAVGYPILRINAVRPMSVDQGKVRFLNISVKDAADYLLEDGDLLFTRYNGSVDLLGVAGLVRGITQGLLHPDKLIRVKAVLPDHMPQYLEMVCNCGESRKHVASKARTTAGQTGVSGSDIKAIPIPLCSIDEQSEIVAQVEAKLSNIAHAETEIKRSLERAARLRQAILRRAFEGRLV